MTDELAAYDYELPEEQIARFPAARRDEARLLVVDRQRQTIEHRLVRDLPELLRAGDCLALNDTRVVRARLYGVRAATGGKWEGLFLNQTEAGHWRLLGQCRGRLQPGELIEIRPALVPESAERLKLRLIEKEEDDGIWQAEPIQPIDVWDGLEQFGTVPLPPYMHRDQADAQDFERYQTVYARHLGSVAAPTAGLHFTPELLDRCAARGVDRAFVTLHVGIGTFRPIAVEKLDQHLMHSEWCDVPAETVARLAFAQARGGRRIAVGTTTTRALESAAQSGRLESWRGPTTLFIRPPYEFRAIDGLLTNFHLPRSTLLVLVSTFAGHELIREAYATAVREGYRFYSYGDAMLIV
ncbi:MAG: tRNA preQ1(34) S-adenosylmethionine ribosyltransferase-isomerase QueA [Planctomycetes bacterium]|nr:tRNA preQ1(34) S-adenosylmethionine ribosyltransferase-isomerase QueA [Planctomycetota bacterium]